MSEDSDKIKALVDLKQYLEKKIEKLDTEIKQYKKSLEAVNSILLEKGFKRPNINDVIKIKADKPTFQEESPKTQKQELKEKPNNVIPLKSFNDETLAILLVEGDSVHLLPDETKKFNVNIPPFTNFLVERVFSKMEEKDEQLVRLNQLDPNKKFSFNVVNEGDLIREIIFNNVDEDRIRELKSSIRWTLEKMYEKIIK